MEIKITGKECEQVLKDYAYVNFGKLLGCEKVDDIDLDIKGNYSDIERMIITKKVVEKGEEAGNGESE